MKIILTAVNAKYIHSNLAVYTLQASAEKAGVFPEIREFTINQSKNSMLRSLFLAHADVVCVSCYIWNISIVEDLITEYHKISPETKIWLGGPEVSYHAEEMLEQYPFLDGIMKGEGEITFRELAVYYQNQENGTEGKTLEEIHGITYRDAEGAIKSNPWRPVMDLSEVDFPYANLKNFENRIIYYESSRGCPFSCSYCLSSIDKRLRFRNLDLVKKELAFFLEQKVPQVKFVDRTFNCKKDHAMAIWKFIAEHDNGVTNFHFEIAADLITEKELKLLNTLRPGLVQLEIGVQSTNPQTIEAINHAKAAGIEIIVAINKIDKPSANIERVKQELTEYELIPEDWGGSTIFVPVSAHTKEGIQELLEMVLLTAEVMELKANPNRVARGLVIEAELDKGKGSVATVLVQKGTLRVGDAIAAGSAHGKVRAMMDDRGRRVKEAGPSQPVEILGLNEVPQAGEVFVGCESEKEARNFAETFISQHRVKMLEETKSKMSLDDLFNQIQEGNLKELNIVVKADVQGSVEAIKQSLIKLSNEEVVIKIIHGGVGAINESDVILASASNAIIIGFNVRPDATAKEIADREGVDLRLYRVIYNAIEDVEAAMKGMLDPVFEEKVLGHAEVRQTFKASGVGTIAGSYVQDGTFERNCSVRLTRDGIVIFDGPLASLKRFKDDVKEVRAGYECGFVFENYNDIKEGDLVEAYKMVEIERK